MLSPNSEENKNQEWHKKDNGLFLPRTYHINVKKKKRSLKQKTHWIIENITIVLLIPSFLGALWQIAELSRINIAYIRFFSVSQIPVDGILILILIILIVVNTKVVIALTKYNFKSKMELIKNEELVERILKDSGLKITASVIWSLLLTGIYVYLILEFFTVIFSATPIFALILLSLSTMGLILYLTDTFLIVMLKKFRGNTNVKYEDIEVIFDNLDKYKMPILWSLLGGTITFLFIMYILLKGFSASFTLPNSLYNTKHLDSIIYNEFETDDYSIEYFNDKYIFVKLCTLPKCNHELEKKIIVYPTEKVLFKATYGKIWTGYFTTYNPVDK